MLYSIEHLPTQPHLQGLYLCFPLFCTPAPGLPSLDASLLPSTFAWVGSVRFWHPIPCSGLSTPHCPPTCLTPARLPLLPSAHYPPLCPGSFTVDPSITVPVYSLPPCSSFTFPQAPTPTPPRATRYHNRQRPLPFATHTVFVAGQLQRFCCTCTVSFPSYWLPGGRLCSPATGHTVASASCPLDKAGCLWFPAAAPTGDTLPDHALRAFARLPSVRTAVHYRCYLKTPTYRLCAIT